MLIPYDYEGEIGVPSSFLEKWDSEQFEIVGADFELAKPQVLTDGKIGKGRFYIKNKRFYARIVIKRKAT